MNITGADCPYWEYTWSLAPSDSLCYPQACNKPPAYLGLYKFAQAGGGEELYVLDPQPWSGTGGSGWQPYYQSEVADASQLYCSTSASAPMTNANMHIGDAANGEWGGVGQRTGDSGWLLLYKRGTYNQDGRHPCPTATGYNSALGYGLLQYHYFCRAAAPGR